MGQGIELLQGNDPKYTSKLCQRYIRIEEEQYVLHLMSWPAQSADINPIELESGMTLTEMSELNKLQVQPTSGHSCRTIFCLLPVFGGESVKQ